MANMLKDIAPTTANSVTAVSPHRKPSAAERLIGPRVPSEVLARHRGRFLAPTLLFVAAAGLILVSVFLPYWGMHLKAPQYPKGLELVVYVNRVEGDVEEIDALNHYIGMRPLTEAAALERSLSLGVILVTAGLVLAAIYVHNPLAFLLTLPAIAWPLMFLGDLFFWMWSLGQNLDPHAPLSNSIKPFVPPLIGSGTVGQFKTVAYWDTGVWLAFAATVLVLAGLYFHRHAYRPLVQAATATDGRR